MCTKATTPHGTDTSHVVHLFDSDDSLADGVAQFFREGLVEGAQMLAVVREERWYSVAMRISALGWPVDDAVRFGRLIVRDARQTLNTFMVGGKIDRRLFFATVETLISGPEAFHRRVRVYGEMVDLLAAQGDYAAALELEGLWNELGDEHEFTLLCGYMAGHFGDPRNADDLRRICAAHDAMKSHPQDVLGPFLLNRFNAA